MFGLFKRYDVEMSPQVRGRITDGGQAVAGIQVARSVMYEGYDKGKEQLEHTITDEDGRFSFAEKIIKSRMPGDIFGQNMPVKQAVYIERSKDLYSLWSASKSWGAVKPLSDLLLQLNCDLKSKELHHEIDASNYGGRPHHVVISICHWQGELIDTYYKNENDELVSFYDDIK